MDTHRRQRLTAVLEAEGLDALVATTTENVYYATGLRVDLARALPWLELYAVFTRRGTALVIPFIDTTGVAADRIEVDHVACYGKFFFEYADEPGEIGRKIREWTRRPRRAPPTRWPAPRRPRRARPARGPSTRATCSRPRGARRGALGPDGARPRLPDVPSGAHGEGTGEVAALERAALVAEDGIAAVLAMLKRASRARGRAGVRAEVLRRGAQPFFTVVPRRTRGPRRRVPLGPRGSRPGDLVRFDLGCLWGAYRSDISRTAVLGAPSDKQAATTRRSSPASAPRSPP